MAVPATRSMGTVAGTIDNGVQTDSPTEPAATTSARDAVLPKIFGIGTVYNPPVGS